VSQGNAIDRVTTSVLAHSFQAIADEMWRNLIRSAYSTIVREASDAATAIFSPDGQMVSQGERTVPMLLESLSTVMEGFRSRGLLEALRPGHALITNDSYAGGQHLWDVVLILPVFDGTTLIGFSGTSAHHLDIGGSLPGLQPRSRVLFEEGLVIPPLRIDLDHDLGPGGLVSAFIRANVRVPDQFIGDLRAQIAACRTGERRLQELVERYGRDVVTVAMQQLLDYSDAMMRNAIRSIPNGTYRAEEWTEFEMDGEKSALRVAVSVDIRDDNVVVDLGGTSGQIEGPINVPLGSTISTIHFTLKGTLVDPKVKPNAGCYRSITVRAPEGSLFNPRFPAAVAARHGLCYVLFDALQAALAPVLRDRLIASSYGSIIAVGMGFQTTDRMYVYREGIGGGYGGGDRYRGADAVATLLVNASNVPIEFAERSHPYFLVRSYSVRRGSGGVGQTRGGFGIEKSYLILADGVTFVAFADRPAEGPRGLYGGGRGARAELQLIRGSQTTFLAPKCVEKVRAGDVIVVRTAGGGGFGSPDAGPIIS
jgi:N-methylhydantoinase B